MSPTIANEPGFGLPALPDLVSQTLREEISQGIIKPGHPIRMRDLAERFGVSAMPVREALRRLEAEGLVTFEKNRRITVKQLSAPELLEVAEIRMELESVALRHAIPHLREDPAALARLSELIDRMDDEPDPDEWRTLNESLHRLIYASAGMPRLESIINSLTASMEPYLRIYVRTQTNVEHAQADHRRLLAHIRAGEIEAAEALLRDHIRYARDRLHERLTAS